jgi:hypothetical protein
LNAISSSFSDAAAVDWRNPSTLFSLLNMLVLGLLLFLCLVALERINRESVKLLKHLDMVGLEVSRVSNVEVSVDERAQDSAARDLAETEAEEHARLLQSLNERLIKNDMMVDSPDDSSLSPRASPTGTAAAAVTQQPAVDQTKRMVRQALKVRNTHALFSL